MARKPKLRDTFGEQYEVSIDYQKPDGYWVCSYRLHVRIPIKHGVNEKCNHHLAEQEALRQFPNAKINSVSYC